MISYSDLSWFQGCIYVYKYASDVLPTRNLRFSSEGNIPVMALLRNKILSAFQSFSQCFYLKKGQKFFLMFSEMLLRSSLFFTSLFGSLQKCLNF